MKKYFARALTMLFALIALTGCSQRTPAADLTSKESLSDSYAQLISYQTEGYAQKSVAGFNQSLLPEDGDLSELLAAYADVTESIQPDDAHYDFITLTLAASLNELYSAQTKDAVGISRYMKKQAQPIAPLPGEEDASAGEPAYAFILNALYTICYTIDAPEDLTVAERDATLQTLCAELQSYIDGLSVNEIKSGSIRTALTDKANTLASRLSTDSLKLSCEISEIEIHNAGVDTQQ